MKVGVLMGGLSSEREVSLNTGREIVNNLDRKKYDVIPIEINEDRSYMDKLKEIDIALLALHGKYGEDGTIQGMLESLGIPYTGCGILSSALCMDKDLAKRIMKFSGINTADWVMVKNTDEIDYEEIRNFGYPVVVKPNSGGSSVATFIVKEEKELLNSVSEALKWDKEVMIEKYIKGDEITCCVLNGEMLPVLAIKPRSEFFDYASKYADGGADEVIVELEEKLDKKVREMAIKCYNALKCSVYSRVDMLIRDGEPFVLEVNTLPGMTKNSLFPKSARSVGISFSALLDLVIEYSLKEKR